MGHFGSIRAFWAEIALAHGHKVAHVPLYGPSTCHFMAHAPNTNNKDASRKFFLVFFIDSIEVVASCRAISCQTSQIEKKIEEYFFNEASHCVVIENRIWEFP